MEEKVVVIIPARYGSTRLPGKVLASLWGKPLIYWVYKTAISSGIESVWVATDDERVAKEVRSFGGKVVMTSSEHPSGTDRIAEAVKILSISKDTIIVNLQADQPLFPREYFKALVEVFADLPEASIATLASPIKDESEVTNPNKVKVVLDRRGYALYFSRASIPYSRDGDSSFEYLKHIGVYAYKKAFLDTFVSLPEGRLEKIEKLEQLRALENGYKIGVKVVERAFPEVDTPEDLKLLNEKYNPPKE